VSTALASAGIGALPFGLPAWGSAAAFVADAEAAADADGAAELALAPGAAATSFPAGSSPSPAPRAPDLVPAQPVRTNAATSAKADKRALTGRARRGLSSTDRL
jgi:hypothetical protein